MFLAHIREENNVILEQTLEDHSRNTARYAGECLKAVGLEQTGVLLGLVHDCGKYKDEFQKYLRDPKGVRGSVNHSFAPTRLLLEQYHKSAVWSERLAAELLAFAVGSHHGLFDCMDENKNSGFQHRLTKANIGYGESRKNFFEELISGEELNALFEASAAEVTAIVERLRSKAANPDALCFQFGLLARLLLSALIEGDRRDTAEFMMGQLRAEEPQDPESFWGAYLERVEEKLSALPVDTPIGRARREISDQCRRMAEEKSGICRLDVPTGGGKTLSSLRYALAHGKKWGKRRLIFTSPLLSILDQNAKVIREHIEDDAVILEHHSNVIRTREDGELDTRELAAESWNSPIIITTLVQLLNTLFCGKTTSIRRFQALCNSVIIIDEVQTVPPRMRTLFDRAVEFLADVCGATVVLCSATQPPLEIKSEIRDIVPHDPEVWSAFRRTVITDAGLKDWDEIVGFVREELEQTESLLLVCNRKDQAEKFFSQLRDGADVAIHLSASMCTAHRHKALEELRDALAEKRKCLCVATQVIEAGVDISFSRVIRLAAGMDSVVQAAGRCNRNGESAQPAPVYVLRCADESLEKLREIKDGKRATRRLLDDYRRDPERFGNDLASRAAIDYYYHKLYSEMSGNYRDYYIEKRRVTLYDLLSQNKKFRGKSSDYFLNQAFKLAGGLFEVFDSATSDLVVPYGEGKELIAELCAQTNPDAKFLADWVQRAKPYSVAVYEWQRKNLGNAVTELFGVALLAEGHYDDDTGLKLNTGEQELWEV